MSKSNKVQNLDGKKLEQRVCELSSSRRQTIKRLHEMKEFLNALPSDSKEARRLQKRIARLSKKYRKIIDTHQEVKKLLARFKK